MREIPPRTIVVGLLGGVASGKSFVAQSLVRRGAVPLDADRVGHEVLREPDVEMAARERWGDGIFDEDGHIDRPALARIVFAPPPNGPHELAYLESLTHPRIEMRLREQLAKFAQTSSPAVIVLDAPVMLKAGWNKFCTSLVFVDAPRDVRLNRALARGWTQTEFERREAAQEPLDVKRKLADTIIDNAGPPEKTEAQINRFWHSLVRGESH